MSLRDSLDQGVLRFRSRVKLFTVVFIVMMASFTVGLFYPVDKGTAKALVKGFNETVMNEFLSQPTFSGKTLFIFFHNLQVLVMVIVPLAGFPMAVYSAFTTGLVGSSLAALIPGLTRLDLLASTFLMPHSLMEYAAFSLAAAESLVVTFSLLKKRSFREESVFFLASLVISASILLLAATAETLYIIMTNEV